jgi:hypothetical protein
MAEDTARGRCEILRDALREAQELAAAARQREAEERDQEPDRSWEPRWSLIWQPSCDADVEVAVGAVVFGVAVDLGKHLAQQSLAGIDPSTGTLDMFSIQIISALLALHPIIRAIVSNT